MGAILAGLVWWGYQYDFGFPEGITEQSAITAHFWNGTWVAAFAVGILTWGLMLYASIAYRRRHGDPMPRQLRYNIPIEVMYTVTPIAMVLAIVFFTVRDEAELTRVSNDQAETVDVTGFRWSWSFYYADHDVYEIGQPSLVDEDLPVLYLPVNEKVQFNLGSPDVIHSFWVPAFLFKMDVVPGRINTFEVTPNELGTFAGKCAELCGVDHSRMLFNVKVVERAEFDAHMDELRALGQTGDPDAGRISDAAQGVE
ncbi:MAG: cytochrome c oxidase subunit 2 [Actinomycetota bacterium]|nr:cytochrome c oxidase subunit 2 [Actinomycetota bacterium]